MTIAVHLWLLADSALAAGVLTARPLRETEP